MSAFSEFEPKIFHVVGSHCVSVEDEEDPEVQKREGDPRQAYPTPGSKDVSSVCPRLSRASRLTAHARTNQRGGTKMAFRMTGRALGALARERNDVQPALRKVWKAHAHVDGLVSNFHKNRARSRTSAASYIS